MQEEIRDLLKRVTTATVRSFSGEPELMVNYSPAAATVSKTAVRLPLPSRGAISKDDLERLRGTADAASLRLRFHDADLHRAKMPSDQNAREVFELVEQVRVESLGSRRMKGVAQNLRTLLDIRCMENGWGNALNREDIPMAHGLALLVRERLTGRELPAVAKKAADMWRPFLEEHGETILEGLAANADDQKAYGEAVYRFLEELELMEPPSGEQDEEEQSSDAQETEGEDSPSDQDLESVGSGAEMGDDMDMPSSPSDDMGSMDGESEEGEEEEQSSGQGEEAPAGPTSRQNWWDPEQAIEIDYKAYTTEYDEEVEADDLADEEELERLRRQLDMQLANLQGVVARIANRLQRRLMAQQQRSWDFDLEEGLLDSSRLARIVANPTHSLSYKWEKETEFRDTVVSLLIDNSGSMRGRPITVAAISADILARTLERCGVKVEVLGFTTKAWKGGRSREKWMSEGKLPNPGRLNDLRHVVYKPADVPWRRAKNNMGLMLKEGLLKENIDGESLLWAYKRLMVRPEDRKILMVISDGAPVDDSTLSSNPGSYLEAHLREVIEWMETKTPVQLTAIGIGHDVTRYYRNAVTLSNPEDLGGTILQNLADLFDAKLDSLHLRG
ncbi:Aerobic cobaltochelatase subunit CobT [Candidatus Terasakiella magnetica]|uniref:Aerobic cobaltochelatase subunit CobT n=1 Tax=Candidatus Terasakiella magnetica TaxID=1867952 RepID=A0A1C3RKU2_9PROT|nr:cobaltochelatase subunit CobT [Candidatus Terasakiella magnetica]SCA57942.1 Aerobic cobaltochelatase subunit CobT [Candidatus Terasakiella magnetica]